MAVRTYPSFLIYFDEAGEYRWKCQAANGEIIADSGEGYKNYADCRAGIDLVTSAAGKVWRTKEVGDAVD